MNVVPLHPTTHAHSVDHDYVVVLLRDDVSLGQLASALRDTQIVISNDRTIDALVIHRAAHG